jgi:RNA polymerase sigma factor (sigma-70 family)
MARLFPTRAIDRLVNAATSGSDDAELLRRYRDTGDPEAFEGIVRRHARTVLGVCRRILVDPHAADDAFQATFLQLVRKARTLHSPAALAAWLYATARRTALRHRRPVPPAQLAEPPAPAQSPLDWLTARELLAAIEGEMARLPEQYRLPLILCYLDGLSKRAAADRLGLSVGVFRGRLDRGRDKLRSALVRRGFAPTAALGLLVPFAESASADLVRRTVGICARGEPASTAVALLATGRPGVLMKAGLVAGLLLLGGLGLIAAAGRAEPSASQARLEPPRPAAPPRQDLYGDPLPPDAVARMGSIRWRHRDDFGSTVYAVPSPTGRLVATRNFVQVGKASVRVWDLSDGRPVCAIPWELTFTDMRFTPDGSRLMLLLPGGVVRFHDPLTGKLLAESKPAVEKVLEGWPQHITDDGRWVVTLGEKRSMTLTEITAGPAAGRHQVRLEPHAAGLDFDRSRFTCDGHTLRCGDQLHGEKPLFLRWDVRTGKLISTTSISTPSGGMCVALSRDGKRFAAWQCGVKPLDELQVWDTETWAKVVELEGGDRKGYGTIRFSPDGRRVAADVARTGEGVAARVWEFDRGRVIGEVKLPGWTFDFELLPDGKTILATCHGGMMFGAWDIATGRRLSPVAGHESPLRHLAFTPDGKTLLTASTDPEERVTAWDPATGEKRQELAAPHGPAPGLMGPSVPFVLTPAGALVTTGKGTLVWTDPKTGRELRRVTPRPITTVMDPHDFFQQERLLLTHDPQTGRPAVLGLHSFGPSPLTSAEPHYRWKDVVTLSDAESGELLAHRTDVWGRYDLTGPAVSPDGRWLVRHSHDPASDTAVELSPALGGRGALKLMHPGDLLPHYLFTPDGQTLITITRRLPPEPPAGGLVDPITVRLWEVRTGKKRLEFTLPLTGKASRSDQTAFAVSPDGRFLAADPAEDKAISVWDLATGAEVARRGGYGSFVQTLAFRPDGRALASGHADGTALVWDLSGLPGVTPAAADRDAAWKDLASADAGKAYRAILALAADPGGVAFLRDRVKPVPEIPASRIQKLVNDLDSDAFATRVAATAALRKLGDVADAELQTLLRGPLPLEQRRRLADVLENRGLTESDPDRLRALRCVEVLERVGSAEARSVLAELAKGAPGARLTREAAGAVRRRGTLSR